MGYATNNPILLKELRFNVIQKQDFAFSVFQPFIADLIAADLVLPDVFFYSFKILIVVDVNAFTLFVIFDFVNPLISCSLEFCHRGIKIG